MKKLLFLLAAVFFAATALNAQRIVCDETCKFEFSEGASASGASPNYAVVSPIGRSTVEMISQAPRLERLDGKTIALVGGDFMANVTHVELKRLLEENYKNVKVLMFNEIGNAGVYPAPGVTRRSKDEFQAKLKALNVDAVITGNCGCGLCTQKEVGNLIAAEYVGVPAVAVAAPGFVEEVFYVSYNNGVAAPRVVTYPGAFASHSAEELTRNTREHVWPQIINALTEPISAAEVARNDVRDKGDIRDDVFYGTLSEVNEHFAEMNWTDGLPVIPPTFEEVSKFLRYTDLAWDETVSVLPVAHRNTTVWHVAVNGVMAGCKPEYMPILIAMTKAMGSGQFRRTLTSTHGWIPYSWLNGPVARQLGFSCGGGEISDKANVALGRFLNLALVNLCGYYAGLNRMGTFGYPMSWCLAEDEEACSRIGWKPYHVRNGYNASDNTVTLSSALLWGNNMAPSTTDPKMLMQLLAWDIAERSQFALGSGKQFTSRTVLITEPVAANLAKKYKNPSQLEADLIVASRRPLSERVKANYYANPGSNPEEKHPLKHWQGHIRKDEHAQVTRTPWWYETSQATMETVATMKEGMTAFLVTGDSSRNKVQTMPGGGFSTVRIELPAEWDALMAELGYPALK